MCTLRRLLGRKWLLLRLLSVYGHDDLGDPSISESVHTSFGDAFPPIFMVRIRSLGHCIHHWVSIETLTISTLPFLSIACSTSKVA